MFTLNFAVLYIFFSSSISISFTLGLVDFFVYFSMLQNPLPCLIILVTGKDSGDKYILQIHTW